MSSVDEEDTYGDATWVLVQWQIVLRYAHNMPLDVVLTYLHQIKSSCARDCALQAMFSNPGPMERPEACGTFFDVTVASQ